jgi:hypothetical protein
LASLLFIFEQNGLTGLFYFSKYQYHEIFDECRNKLPGRLDENNAGKPILSNTTLNKLANESICKYGDKCTRHNHEHIKQFHTKTYTVPRVGTTTMKSTHKPVKTLKTVKKMTRVGGKNKKTSKTRKGRKTLKRRKTQKNNKRKTNKRK